MSESGFELQHSGSPSEKAALEEKAQTSFFSWEVGAGGVGRQEIAEAAGTELRAGGGAAGGRRIEVHPDFDTSTFERLVGILERA